MHSSHVWNYPGYGGISMSMRKQSSRLEKPDVSPKHWCWEHSQSSTYVCPLVGWKASSPWKSLEGLCHIWKLHRCQKRLWLLPKPAGDQVLWPAVHFAGHTCGDVSSTESLVVTNVCKECSPLLIHTFYFLLWVETDGIQFSHNYY